MVVEFDIKKSDLDSDNFEFNFNHKTLNKTIEKKILIENLQYIVNLFEDDMTNWLDRFAWQKDSLLLMNKNNNINNSSKYVVSHPINHQVYLTCPFNSGHTKILEKNYDKHVNKCQLKSLGYRSQDIAEIYNKSNQVKRSDYQVELSQQKQNQLLLNIDRVFSSNNNEKKLPIPFDHLEYMKLKKIDDDLILINRNERTVSLSNNHMFINYSNQERLKIYENAIEESKLLNYPFNSDKTWNEKGFLEMSQDKNEQINKKENVLAELRDKKRRPKSYRTTKSKSFTEQLKDLISTQMSLLNELNKKSTDTEISIHKKRADSLSKTEAETSSRFIYKKKKI